MYLGLYITAILITVVALFSLPYALYCVINHTAMQRRMITAVRYHQNKKRALATFLSSSITAAGVFVIAMTSLHIV